VLKEHLLNRDRQRFLEEENKQNVQTVWGEISKSSRAWGRGTPRSRIDSCPKTGVSAGAENGPGCSIEVKI